MPVHALKTMKFSRTWSLCVFLSLYWFCFVLSRRLFRHKRSVSPARLYKLSRLRFSVVELAMKIYLPSPDIWAIATWISLSSPWKPDHLTQLAHLRTVSRYEAAEALLRHKFYLWLLLTVDSRSNGSAYNRNRILTIFLSTLPSFFEIFHSDTTFYSVPWKTLEQEKNITNTDSRTADNSKLIVKN